MIGRHWTELDTPVLLVDLDRLLRNVERMAALARAHGVALRPHVKTHKSTAIARMQIDAGAVGLTAAKLDEAEVFANAGFADHAVVRAGRVVDWWPVEAAGAVH